MSCVEIVVPDSLRDGSTQNILLKFTTQNGDIEVKDEMSMPFEAKKDIPETLEPTEEPEEQPTIEPKSALVETAQPVPTEEVYEPESSGIDITTIGGIALVAVGLLVLLFSKFLKKKPNKKSGKKQKDIPINDDFGLSDNPVMDSADDNKTVFLGNESEEAKTVFLGGINSTDAKILIVRDVNIVINYDPSVSGRHLAVSMQGDRLYIEDLNSSNGTSISGQRVSGIIPVAAGCQIEIGRVHIILDVE